MFHTKKPITPLQAFIEQTWYCNYYIDSNQRTLTLPYGRIEMVINLNGIYNIQKEDFYFKGKEAWISGQQNGVTVSTIAGQHECIGIVFTPLGWKLFSGIDACELKNSFVQASAVLKNFGDVIALIAVKTTAAEKIAALENYLQKQAVNFKRSNNNIHNALDIIQHCKDAKLTVNQLSKQLKLSRKSLNNLFQNYIGLSASGYLQQRFFSHLLHHLCSEPRKRLIEHTYEHHFFDQSHFIKQFQAYAGMTPGQYLLHAKEQRIDPLFPNFISL